MNVVLISRDHRLGAILTMALPSPEGLTLLDSPAEVPDPREAVIDAVVLDLPADSRRDAYQELRQRYEGRVVVPVDNAKDTNGWPPDSKRRFLVRPFQVADLIAGVQEPEETSVAERAARYRRLFRWNRQHVPAFPDISAPPAAEQPAARVVDLEAAGEQPRPDAEDEEPLVAEAEDEQPVEAAAEEQRLDAEDGDDAEVGADAEVGDEERFELAADEDVEDEASFGAETEDGDGDGDELTEAITAEDAEEAASAEGEDDEATEAAAAGEPVEAEAERLDDESGTDDAEAETQEFLALDDEDDEQAEAEAEEPPEAEAEEPAGDEEEQSLAAAVEAALREELDLAEGSPDQAPALARAPVPPLPVQAGVAMAKAVALQQWLEAEEARRTSGRRRRVVANVAAGLVLLLVGVGIGMALGSEEPQQVSPPATPQPVVQIRNAPPPAACTQAMDNADAVISYLVAKIRDQRLSESIQDYGANARACRRSGGNP